MTDPISIATALLYATTEDTETTEAELRERFGDEVTGVVLEVTDDKSLPKARGKQLQVEQAPHFSQRAKLVKLADKTANLRDMLQSPPADLPLKRRHEYALWAKNVIDGLRGAHPKLESIFDTAHRAMVEALESSESS